MRYTVNGRDFSVTFEVSERSALIAGGSFLGIGLAKAELLTVLLQNVRTKEEKTLTSSSFESVRVHATEGEIRFAFRFAEILFSVSGIVEDSALLWSVEVENRSEEWSVIEVSYPLPRVSAPRFDLFEPGICGKVIKDAGRVGFSFESLYPVHHLCMQYFAIYNENGGIYLGIEDPTASVKYFKIQAGDGAASITSDFYGIGGTLPRNSFKLAGVSRWQAFCGDWYDATIIYKRFVQERADWLPALGENGRPDTPEPFKRVPFWVCDYIPNSETQGENRPMRLSAGSDRYEKDYWYRAVIELKEALDVPIAYHVYNWHEIPFNIEYPHFLPAKQGFAEGLAELKAHGVYVLPYINAVSWEIHDGDAGHAVNYDNTGCHGAVLDRKGEPFVAVYPQRTKSGKPSALAPMCPSFEGWQDIIERLSREMERTLDIDGIYYDQISAEPAHPCYNPEHPHLPGGGSFWVDGYNRMMERIKEKKPKDAYYFSECNAEPYVKSFDGYLTWCWAQNGEVPAFPAIYGGYIQLIGRYTIGPKKEDYEFFKYSTARALLDGQQLGWCKADVLYRPKWFSYLKSIVDIRYRYTDLFNQSEMLRPPYVNHTLQPIATGSADLWFEDEPIVMERMYSAAWRYRDGRGIVLFLCNLAEEDADYTLTVDAEEYELSRYLLPDGFSVADGVCTCRGKIGALECKVFELTSKESICSTKE